MSEKIELLVRVDGEVIWLRWFDGEQQGGEVDPDPVALKTVKRALDDSLINCIHHQVQASFATQPQTAQEWQNLVRSSTTGQLSVDVGHDKLPRDGLKVGMPARWGDGVQPPALMPNGDDCTGQACLGCTDL